LGVARLYPGRRLRLRSAPAGLAGLFLLPPRPGLRRSEVSPQPEAQFEYCRRVEQQGKACDELNAQWNPYYWRELFEDEVRFSSTS